MIERNRAKSGSFRVALAAIFVLGVASARSRADIPIASDSYVTGSDPTQGQYVAYNGTQGALSGQPTNLANTGFKVGGYTGGVGTINFVASSTGLVNDADGASAASGSVYWIGATGAARSVARSLSASFIEGSTGTYWTSMLVSYSGNTTTTDSYILSGFGGTAVPASGTGGASTGGNVTGIFFGFSNDSGTANEQDLVLRYRDSSGATSKDVQLLNGANNSLASQTFLVVAQINVNSNGSNDQVNYWVNPTSLSSVAALTSTSLVSGTVTTLSFQGSPTGVGDFTRLNYLESDFNGDAFFDEARLGITLASIAPATVPEPSALALTALGGGLVVVGAFRRRLRSTS